MTRLLTAACLAAALALPGVALAAPSGGDHTDNSTHSSGGGDHGGGGGHSGGGGGGHGGGAGGGHGGGGHGGPGGAHGGSGGGGPHPAAVHAGSPPGAHGGFHGVAHGGAGGRGGPAPRSVRNTGPHFAAGAVSRLGAQQQSLWRGGHWWRGNRNGRDGWWWLAGDFGYYYDEAAFPYPEYASDVSAPNEDTGLWYYCDDPAGYYPYVKECRTPWRAVDPTPAPDGSQDDADGGGGPPPPDTPPPPESSPSASPDSESSAR
jgi:hypothetical protein